MVFSRFLVTSESCDVGHDSVEVDFGVLAGVDVPVVLAEVVVVSVVVAQYRPVVGGVVLESIEPPARVVAVRDGEHLDTAARDGAVQFKRVDRRHSLRVIVYEVIEHNTGFRRASVCSAGAVIHRRVRTRHAAGVAGHSRTSPRTALPPA